MSCAEASSRALRILRWTAFHAAFWAGPAAFADRPPDWVGQSITAARDWKTGSPTELILKSESVRFTSADFQHISVISRGVIRRVARAEGPNFAAVGYNPNTGRIVSAAGWLVRPDGTVVTTFSRRDFTDQVAMFNKYFWYERREFYLGAAQTSEGGDYAAWEIQYEEQTGFKEAGFRFLNSIPCFCSEFEAIPAAGGKIDWHAGSSKIGDPVSGLAPGSLKWTVLKQAPRTADRPSGYLPNPMNLVVRCANANDSKTGIGWKEMAQAVSTLVDPQIDSAGAVRAEGEKLAAGKPERWARIRALAEFVQTNIVYLSVDLDHDSLEGCRPHPSADVLTHRYGDCKDKATLLVSLLRSVHEDGRVVLLNGSGDPSYVDNRWPADYFNHAIVAIPADSTTPAGWPTVALEGLGRMVIFDPTDSQTPLGVLNPNDQGGYGLLIDATNGQIFPLPSTDKSATGVKRRVEAALSSTGGLSVAVKEDCHGLAAAGLRRVRAGADREHFQANLERQIGVASPGASLAKWTDDWNPREARYLLEFDYHASDYGHPMSNGMMTVVPNVYAQIPQVLPWRTRAEGKVFLPPLNIDDEVRLTLPEGYKVEELPDPSKFEGRSAGASLIYRTEGSTVVYTAHSERRGGFYDLADYEEMRLIYRKMAEAAKRPVLLIKETSQAR